LHFLDCSRRRFGARYDWGLRDAFKDNLAKTRTLAILLGWRLR